MARMEYYETLLDGTLGYISYALAFVKDNDDLRELLQLESFTFVFAAQFCAAVRVAVVHHLETGRDEEG